LRHAPKLEFEFDDSFEKAAKLTELIDRAPK
jgi:ribosome-binding factor A